MFFISFFKETLLFAMKHTPDLLYVLMRHSFTNQKLLDHTSVIKAATVYSQLAISINPTLYSAFNKWLSVVVQALPVIPNLFHVFLLPTCSQQEARRQMEPMSCKM